MALDAPWVIFFINEFNRIFKNKIGILYLWSIKGGDYITIRKIRYAFPKDKGLSEEIRTQTKLVRDLSRYSISVLVKLVKASNIEDEEVNDQVWDILYKGYSDEEVEALLNKILDGCDA